MPLLLALRAFEAQSPEDVACPRRRRRVVRVRQPIGSAEFGALDVTFPERSIVRGPQPRRVVQPISISLDHAEEVVVEAMSDFGDRVIVRRPFRAVTITQPISIAFDTTITPIVGPIPTGVVRRAQSPYIQYEVFHRTGKKIRVRES